MNGAAWERGKRWNVPSSLLKPLWSVPVFGVQWNLFVSVCGRKRMENLVSCFPYSCWKIESRINGRKRWMGISMEQNHINEGAVFGFLKNAYGSIPGIFKFSVLWKFYLKMFSRPNCHKLIAFGLKRIVFFAFLAQNSISSHQGPPFFARYHKKPWELSGWFSVI